MDGDRAAGSMLRRSWLAVVLHQAPEPSRAEVSDVGRCLHDIPLIRRRPANVQCPEAFPRPDRLCASRLAPRPESMKPALDHVAIDRAIVAPGAGEPPDARPALDMARLGHLSETRLEDEQGFVGRLASRIVRTRRWVTCRPLVRILSDARPRAA